MTKKQRRAYWRKWWLAHRTERNKQKTAHRVAHRYAYRMARGIWTLRDRHKGQEIATVAQVAALFEQQQRICPLTGRALTLDNAQLDHIVPFSRGGPGTIDNLRWVHEDANQAKSNMSDRDFDAVCVDRAKVLGMRF